MTKKIYIVVLSAALSLVVNAGFCYAEGITIGDENVWIVVTTHNTAGKFGVPIIITDPKGRRMGYDPRNDKWIIEFDAGYDRLLDTYEDWTEETEQKYNTDPEYRENYDKSMGVTYDIAFNLIPGDYMVEAIGEGLIDYRLGIRISHWVKGLNDRKLADINFRGVIDKGLTSKFKFTYTSDLAIEKPGSGERIAEPGSLRQDITLARKIGWIDSDDIRNSLLAKVNAFEASIAKGNRKTAGNQLNAFINEVEAQKGKHISEKAAKMLIEDAQYLIKLIVNCPSTSPDTDKDGVVDDCDLDDDGDGILDVSDNCPLIANPNQADADVDGIGDACDPLTDTDKDGIADNADNCPSVYNPDQLDSNGNSIGDVCDIVDSDRDGIPDQNDNCPWSYNPDQIDGDHDGMGDVCDTAADSDGDRIPDQADNCPYVFNPDQADANGNGTGDACEFPDADSDRDDIADSRDNCPYVYNPDQRDSDRDGVGDVCDR